MESVLKADIFFVISSISAVVLTIAIVVAVYYFVMVLREIRALIHSVQSEVTRFKKRRHMFAVYMRTLGKFVKYAVRQRSRK